MFLVYLVYQLVGLFTFCVVIEIVILYAGDLLLFAVIMSRCVMPCACMENMATITVHSV